MTGDNVNETTREVDLPEGALFWRWAGRATRPYAGWGLIALGALLLLLGYLGVSREAMVAKQIPYMVSGGIAGVALVAVGAFFLGTEDLRRQLSRLDRIEEMVEQLHGVLLRQAPDPSDAPSANGTTAGRTVRATRPRAGTRG